MLFLLACLAIFVVCTFSDVFSILWRQACDESRHHRAAVIAALISGISLLDFVLVVRDLRFFVPVILGEIAGSYVGIWIKDRLAARSARAAAGDPKLARRLHVV